MLPLRSAATVMAACTLFGPAIHSARALLLSAVSATTDMGSGFTTDLINTINGVGLSSLSLTATHAGTLPTNSWVSQMQTFAGQVTFNLGGSQVIDGFSFWNQNGGGPGLNGATGIDAVTILGSLDGTTFSPIPGTPTMFAQQMANTNVPPEIFSFTPVAAAFIRFQIGGNWGDPGQTGFAEVQFSAVPAPSALLVAATAAGAALLRRRR